MKVTVSIYGPNQDQPMFESVATDYDETRTEDKIYLVTEPNGDRIFITVDVNQ